KLKARERQAEAVRRDIARGSGRGCADDRRVLDCDGDAPRLGAVASGDTAAFEKRESLERDRAPRFAVEVEGRLEGVLEALREGGIGGQRTNKHRDEEKASAHESFGLFGERAMRRKSGPVEERQRPLPATFPVRPEPSLLTGLT